MSAQHGIVGEDFGTELPRMEMPEQDLTNEKNMAKFSRSVEFRKLKEHLEERIGFYQTYLPSGEAVPNSNMEELASRWVIANTIIYEFRALIQAYERAREVVEESQTKGNT